VEEAIGRRPEYFSLRDLHVSIGLGVDNETHDERGDTKVDLEIGVGDERARGGAQGEGPVHAMDLGLRSLIDRFYPQLKQMRLVDYKVRVTSSGDGTGAVVRVLIQSSDGDEVWGTVGVSPNIIHASWHAMVDAIDYKLMKDGVEPHLPRARRKTAPVSVRARQSEVPEADR
jgi:2-isopropylmalate synthase